MEKEKYLRIYTDKADDTSRFCIKDKHSNFIAYDISKSGDPVMEIYDHLPKEFEYISYMDKTKCEELTFLGRCEIDFIDLLTSTDDIVGFKKNVIYEINKFKALHEHKWEIVSFGVGKITLQTQLVYVSDNEMDKDCEAQSE